MTQKEHKLRNRVHISLIALGLLFTLVAFRVRAPIVDTVQVRLFSHLKVQQMRVYSPTAGYRLVGDGDAVMNLRAGLQYRLLIWGDSVKLYEVEKAVGTYKYIKVVGQGNNELKIQLIQPERKLKTYQDNVSFSVSDGGIRVINEVDLDHYIAGVTDAEAGIKCSPEFYKVQAILARTFALAHINKHINEGFSLCDLVHCQAYQGKPRDLNVVQAVEGTEGLVVVDQNLDLIVAAFHSNSGGQTANSEDVWGSKTTYLRSIVDTFGTRMPNATWEKRISTDEWLGYLKEKYNFPVDNDSGKMLAMSFTQDTRKTYLEFNNNKVPLKTVRQDLNLKSTFFTVTPIGRDSVLLKGRGYGHGLGMCQEGAMCMAKKGYSYTDILNFYYRDIQLIDLHKLRFFRDE